MSKYNQAFNYHFILASTIFHIASSVVCEYSLFMIVTDVWLRADLTCTARMGVVQSLVSIELGVY
jgi:predicted DNA repair protein MutK